MLSFFKVAFVITTIAIGSSSFGFTLTNTLKTTKEDTLKINRAISISSPVTYALTKQEYHDILFVLLTEIEKNCKTPSVATNEGYFKRKLTHLFR